VFGRKVKVYEYVLVLEVKLYKRVKLTILRIKDFALGYSKQS
jgi:hypothetical protein